MWPLIGRRSSESRSHQGRHRCRIKPCPVRNPSFSGSSGAEKEKLGVRIWLAARRVYLGPSSLRWRCRSFSSSPHFFFHRWHALFISTRADQTKPKKKIRSSIETGRVLNKKKPGTKNERTLQRMQIYSFFLTPPHFLPRRIVRFYTSSFSTSIESRPKSYRKKNTQKKSLINRITDRSSIESKKRNHWKNGVTEQKKSIGDAIRTTV